MKTRDLLKKINMFIVIILFQWVGSICNAYAYQNDLTENEYYALFEEFMDECFERWCTKEFQISISDFFCSFKKKQCSFTLDFFEYRTEQGVIEDSFVSLCSITVQSKEELFPKTFRVPDHIMEQTEKCVNRAYPKAIRYYESL